MPTRKVHDIHPHIITTDEVRYPRAPLGGTQSAWSKERPATYEQLLAAMDDAGVDKAAIVQSSTCYGFDNSYVVDAVAARPDRYTGVFSVDVLAPDGPAKIRELVARKQGGLRLFTTGSTMPNQATWLDDPRVIPSFRTCVELGIPVCVQMKMSAIPQLENVMRQVPEATIILDHFMQAPTEDGAPYREAAPLFEMARHPRVYLKLTPLAVAASKKGKATPETWFGQVVKAYGANRIAWGSNWPNTPGTLKEILDEARAALAFLPQEDQEWIFWRTAETLYRALRD